MIPLVLMLIGLRADSKIDSVVMYSDRVIVARKASVYLENATEIVFPDLPGSLDDQSVRVKAQGVTIGEVQVKTGYMKEPHPKVKELQARIRELEIRDRAYNDELAVLKDKEKFLQTVATGASDVISKEMYTGKIAPGAWDLGLKFIVDGLLAAKGRTAEIERARVDLQEKIDALKLELDNTRASVENRKAVVFDAKPKSAQTYTIELDYVVFGASWRTYYELRADPADKKIEVDYYGKISQRTGEDWDNVRIVLSTAAPSYGGSAPTTEPWYIYSYRSEDYGGYEEGRALAAAPKEAISESSVLVGEQQAQVVETGIGVWYPLPHRYSIASGEAEKKMTITARQMGAQFAFFTVPRLDMKAYLSGEMNNSTDFLFLAGDANTYVGDDYTGRSYFPTVAPDESIRTFFGVDERVKVKRELKKSKVSKGGLFKSTTKYDIVYENSIKNFHDQEITCTIVDMVPVPQDAAIKVGDVKLEPKPTREDKDRGIYYWDVPIQANAEFVITVSFTVEAPPEIDIQRQMY